MNNDDSLLTETRVSPGLRWLLAAAAAPTEPGAVPGEAGALADFRRARAGAGGTPTMARPPSTRMALAAAGSACLLLAGSYLGAAAGALPGAAQEMARDILAAVGVTVPGPDAGADGHPGQPGAVDATPTSPGGAAAPDRPATPDRPPAPGRPAASPDRPVVRDTPSRAAEPAPDQVPVGAPVAGPVSPDPPRDPGNDLRPEPAPPDNHGGQVSEVARTTGATGAAKGAEVSDVASRGRSRPAAPSAERRNGARARPRSEGAQDPPGRRINDRAAAPERRERDRSR